MSGGAVVIDLICEGSHLITPEDDKKLDTLSIVGHVIAKPSPLKIPQGLVRITIEPAEFSATPHTGEDE